MSKYFVTAVRVGDEGHIEECLVSDAVRNADGFAIDNARPMAAREVARLIELGHQVFVWNDDDNGGSTQDEIVTVLPDQLARLDSSPAHLLYQLPEL